jgi:hypothetical protein
MVWGSVGLFGLVLVWAGDRLRRSYLARSEDLPG